MDSSADLQHINVLQGGKNKSFVSKHLSNRLLRFDSTRILAGRESTIESTVQRVYEQCCSRGLHDRRLAVLGTQLKRVRERLIVFRGQTLSEVEGHDGRVESSRLDSTPTLDLDIVCRVEIECFETPGEHSRKVDQRIRLLVGVIKSTFWK